MGDYSLLVSDLHRLTVALRKAGYSCSLAPDGALVTTCTLEQARTVARAAGVRISQQWPPAYRVAIAPAGSPPADTPQREEQP